MIVQVKHKLNEVLILIKSASRTCVYQVPLILKTFWRSIQVQKLRFQKRFWWRLTSNAFRSKKRVYISEASYEQVDQVARQLSYASTIKSNNQNVSGAFNAKHAREDKATVKAFWCVRIKSRHCLKQVVSNGSYPTDIKIIYKKPFWSLKTLATYSTLNNSKEFKTIHHLLHWVIWKTLWV